MFIENIIKGKDKFYPIKVEGFEDTYFEARELTTREQKEISAMMLEGAGQSNLSDAIEYDEKGNPIDKEVQVPINLAQFELNTYNSNLQIIRTVYRYGEKKTSELKALSDELLERLTDEQIMSLVTAYNKKFNPEDAESFPGKQKES